MIYEIEAERKVQGVETCFYNIEASSEEEAIQTLKDNPDQIPIDTWEDYIEVASDLYNIKIVDSYEK